MSCLEKMASNQAFNALKINVYSTLIAQGFIVSEG
jgi:hypothetical protein